MKWHDCRLFAIRVSTDRAVWFTVFGWGILLKRMCPWKVIADGGIIHMTWTRSWIIRFGRWAYCVEILSPSQVVETKSILFKGYLKTFVPEKLGHQSVFENQWDAFWEGSLPGFAWYGYLFKPLSLDCWSEEYWTRISPS